MPFDRHSSLPEVNSSIEEIARERVSNEARKPGGRPLEMKEKFRELEEKLAEKQRILKPEEEKQKEFQRAKEAVLELLSPGVSSEGREFTYSPFYKGLGELDPLIEGVTEHLDKRSGWTKEKMADALKDDSDIRNRTRTLEEKMIAEKRRDAKRLFLEAYLAELEVTGFTNPEEVKQKLRERLFYIEESLFEAFWKETVSSEDVLLPVIEKIGEGIENVEVRERLTGLLRAGDLSQIFSFLGEQRDILEQVFSKDLVSALRFLLSQIFDKKVSKDTLTLPAFSSFIQFSESFPSFIPSAVGFYQELKRERSLKRLSELRPTLDQVLKKYLEYLPQLSRRDRGVVDTLLKFYNRTTDKISLKYNSNFFEVLGVSLAKNRRKPFETSHLISLIKRAFLEKYGKDSRKPDIWIFIEKSRDLGFLLPPSSSSSSSYFEQQLNLQIHDRLLADPLVLFLLDRK